MNKTSKKDYNVKLNNKTLALFFTAGISLKTWHDIGSLEREVAIYNKLSKYFNEIYFFTYGNEEDLKFKKYLANNIEIIPKRYVSNDFLYSLLIPFIHYNISKNVSIIKTNQMWGSWSAILTKIIHRNKLIVRTGYMLSANFKKENPKNWKINFFKFIEKIAYKNADAIITTSKSCFKYIEKNYNPKVEHALIPNYIDTDLFKPFKEIKKKNSICFVGRLSKEKNAFNLLEALKDLDCSLSIIGSGPLLKDLKNQAKKNNLKVNFWGNIKNKEIPRILNQHELFILPSFYEGMPKALLEAMSCSVPVIGTNVSGINEVIQNEDNGILCNTDSDSIGTAILKLKENENLRKKIGKNARDTIIKYYELNNLVLKELKLMEELV